MNFYLDTDTCILFLRGKDGRLLEHVQRHWPEDIKIPSMVKAELLLGVEKSLRRDETAAAVRAFLHPYEIVPFDGNAADCYASLRADLERTGHVIGPNDLIIAATVISRQGRLVTHNTKEFSRIRELKTVDWSR